MKLLLFIILAIILLIILLILLLVKDNCVYQSFARVYSIEDERVNINTHNLDQLAYYNGYMYAIITSSTVGYSLAKYVANSGYLVWRKQIFDEDVNYTDLVNVSVKVDASGIYVTGELVNSDVLIGGVSLTRTSGEIIPFLAKWDLNMTFVWATQPTNDGVNSTSLAFTLIDNSGLYIGGNNLVGSTATFDTFTLNENTNYVAKYDKRTGEVLWLSYASSNQTDPVFFCATQDDDYVYVGGQFGLTDTIWTFNTTDINAAQDAIYIVIAKFRKLSGAVYVVTSTESIDQTNEIVAMSVCGSYLYVLLSMINGTNYFGDLGTLANDFVAGSGYAVTKIQKVTGVWEWIRFLSSAGIYRAASVVCKRGTVAVVANTEGDVIIDESFGTESTYTAPDTNERIVVTEFGTSAGAFSKNYFYSHSVTPAQDNYVVYSTAYNSCCSFIYTFGEGDAYGLFLSKYLF